MTRDEMVAICARIEGGYSIGGCFIDAVRNDLVALLAEVERLTAEVEAKTTQNVALIGQNGRLQQKVERLTADPLPAAAWVREVERAAFRRGVAAMREAAAKECWKASDELADVPDMESEQGTLQNVAYRIRAIPDPEDKP